MGGLLADTQEMVNSYIAVFTCTMGQKNADRPPWENMCANNYELSMDSNLIYRQLQNYEKVNSKASLIIFHHPPKMSPI